MNPMELLQIRGLWAEFQRNHPKFPMFMQAAYSTGVKEGTIIECKIVSPEGKVLETNLKVKESDLRLFEVMSNMAKNNK